jgi:hypothetical protein
MARCGIKLFLLILLQIVCSCWSRGAKCKPLTMRNSHTRRSRLFASSGRIDDVQNVQEQAEVGASTRAQAQSRAQEQEEVGASTRAQPQSGALFAGVEHDQCNEQVQVQAQAQSRAPIIQQDQCNKQAQAQAQAQVSAQVSAQVQREHLSSKQSKINAMNKHKRRAERSSFSKSTAISLIAAMLVSVSVIMVAYMFVAAMFAVVAAATKLLLRAVAPSLPIRCYNHCSEFKCCFSSHNTGAHRAAHEAGHSRHLAARARREP